MKFDELKEILFGAAAGAGLREYEIYYKYSTGISAKTLKDEISSFSSGTDCGLCFRCKVNGKMGYASTQLMEPEEMRELVDRAIANAGNIECDDEVYIYPGSEQYADEPDNRVVMPDASVIRGLALELQKCNYAATDKADPATQSAALAEKRIIRICNSYGLDLCCTIGITGGYSTMIVNSGGEKANGFAFRKGTTIEELSDAATEAAESALAKIGAGEVESGDYNLIIDAKEMKSLLAAFSSVFSAKSAQNGLSLLAGKEGKQVAAECVTLIDDPMREGTGNRIHFDAEGVATYKKEIVSGGMLNTLMYNLTCAAKAGCRSTGNASKGGYAAAVGVSPFTFYIKEGVYSRAELLKLAGDGILITEIKGLNAGANAVTGDFSVESAGFEFKDGRITRPVKTFTIAGNFFGLMMNIRALGDTVEFGIPSGLTVFGAPDVLVPGISVAGK